jgi:putative tryptophan/tyrosine transport system substrate-binding protein
MNRKIFCLALCALLLALCVSAEAQQLKKVPRIGFLFNIALSPDPARREAFQLGLRELGYVEATTIVIEGDMQREK